MSIVFETGSGKWVRFLQHDVQFVSDRTQATRIDPDNFGALVFQHKLNYCLRTLELQAV